MGNALGTCDLGRGRLMMAALCCTEWRHSVVSSNPSRTPWVPLIVGAPIFLEIIMSQHRFQAESFTPTQWSTAEQKAAFANQLMAFIASGFPENKFTKAFYNRLCACFSFIAHTDRAGFVATFFTCTSDKLDFLRQLATCPCYGSPQFTFSDLERTVSGSIRSIGYVEVYEAKLRSETETHEKALLAILQAKYEASEAPTIDPIVDVESVFAAAFGPCSVATLVVSAPPADVQFALFG